MASNVGTGDGALGLDQADAVPLADVDCRQDTGLLADAPKVPVEGASPHWGRDEFHRFARSVLAANTDAVSVCVRVRYSDGVSLSYEVQAPSGDVYDPENWE